MIDPSTIDMKMALEMTYGKYGEPLSLKCDKFPDVVDFDELEKIKPPRGYGIRVYSRDLKIEMSSFRGICPGAVHYYCRIRFNDTDVFNKETEEARKKLKRLEDEGDFTERHERRVRNYDDESLIRGAKLTNVIPGTKTSSSKT